MRQRGDSEFCKLLCRIRTADHTDDDIATLKSREVTSDMPNYPHHALHVCRLNVDVDDRNSHMLNALAPKSQQYSIKACDSIAGQTDNVDLSNLSDKRSETGGLHSVLKVAIGARVMLTTNVDVSDGLVNGARGEVVHVVTSNDHKVTHILVKFDNPDVGAKAKHSSQFRDQYSDTVPLKKHEAVFLAKGRCGSEVTRLQFPLTLAWAITIHKVQGLTLDEIVVDMKGSRFNPGQAYVALSRVKKLEGLHIVNFNEKAIKASQDVKGEMERLNKNLLSPLPMFTCPDNHISIALLNVRSLVAKLPDIECDHSLTSASILCFTETWLTPQLSSPNILGNHQPIRSDRTSGDNKGGVLISIPANVQTSNETEFSFSGILIEALSTTLLLPNGSSIQLTVVYRSPSVSIDNLLHVMSGLLSHLESYNMPSIVLGDFNEDLLAKPDSRLLTLMSQYKYSQLVHTPTTDKGTLIDHVYCNIPPQFIKIQVTDTYYSDHDTVFCSIPL